MLLLGRCADNGSSRNLLRIASKATPYPRSTFTSSCLRTAAPSARVKAVRIPTTKTVSPRLPSRQNVTAEQMRAIHNADKLYQAGKTALFRAPSHFGYLLGSWTLGLGCIACTTFMIWLGHWKTDPDSTLPWFVPVAYRLSMFTTTSLGLWILLRSTRLVTAIDLIEHAGQGKMRVSVRRIVPAPFVPPRRFIIAPYDLHLPKRALQPAQVPQFAKMPEEGNSNKPLRFGTWAGRKISFTLWSFFAGQRKIMTHEGFLPATIKGQTGQFKIDISGNFPNGANSLVDVSTFEAD